MRQLAWTAALALCLAGCSDGDGSAPQPQAGHAVATIVHWHRGANWSRSGMTRAPHGVARSRRPAASLAHRVRSFGPLRHTVYRLHNTRSAPGRCGCEAMLNAYCPSPSFPLEMRDRILRPTEMPWRTPADC